MFNLFATIPDLPPAGNQRQVQPALRLDAHQRIQSRGKVQFKVLKGTVCPRSCDPFYIVSYYIKWVTASWIYSNDIIDNYLNQLIHSFYVEKK